VFDEIIIKVFTWNKKKKIIREIIRLQDQSSDDLAITTYPDLMKKCGINTEAKLHNLILELCNDKFIDRTREVCGPMRRLRVTSTGRTHVSFKDSLFAFLKWVGGVFVVALLLEWLKMQFFK